MFKIEFKKMFGTLRKHTRNYISCYELNCEFKKEQNFTMTKRILSHFFYFDSNVHLKSKCLTQQFKLPQKSKWISIHNIVIYRE